MRQPVPVLRWFDILGGMMLKYVVLFLLFTVTAEARDRNGQFALGGGGGFVLEAPWASAAFRDAVGPGLKVSGFGRYHHDSSTSGFELTLDYFQLSSSDLQSLSGSLSFFWRFWPGRKVHPMFSIGLGLSKAKAFFQSGDGDQPFYRLRAGVEWEMRENLDLAFHLDHFTMFKNRPTEPNLHVVSPSISVIQYFGQPPAPAPAKKEEAPKAAGGDADEDGITDSVDYCPRTPKGQKANALGCAIRQSFELVLAVEFKGGQSVFSSQPDGALAELARMLKEHPEMKAEIQGHTDNRGAAARNRRLSQARAEAVRSHLVRVHKINPKRLIARGYGSSRPAEANSTAKGRAANNRVVARVIR